MEWEEVFIHHLSSISMGDCHNNKVIFKADFGIRTLYGGIPSNRM
jgi:hypothetical protein